MNKVRITVVTVIYNCKDHITDCINSVISQSYDNVEYILIDGGSTDGSMDIVNRYKEQIATIISEKDNGIYDALNKGIDHASGDVIVFLNADDIYADDRVLETVADIFNTCPDTEAVYGDLLYVSKQDVGKAVRYWKSGEYSKFLFKTGWTLPHPTFFVSKRVYDKYGGYDTSLRIAADYEMIVRLLFRNDLKVHYLPKILVKMRLGGISNRNISTILQKSVEDLATCRKYRVGFCLLTILLKNISKIAQFTKRYNHTTNVR